MHSTGRQEEGDLTPEMKWGNAEETPFLLTGYEEKTYQPCLEGEPQFPGELRCSGH